MTQVPDAVHKLYPGVGYIEIVPFAASTKIITMVFPDAPSWPTPVNTTGIPGSHPVPPRPVSDFAVELLVPPIAADAQVRVTTLPTIVYLKSPEPLVSF